MFGCSLGLGFNRHLGLALSGSEKSVHITVWAAYIVLNLGYHNLRSLVLLTFDPGYSSFVCICLLYIYMYIYTCIYIYIYITWYRL